MGDPEVQAQLGRSQAGYLKLADAILEWMEKNPPQPEEPRDQYRVRLAQLIANNTSPIGVPGIRRMLDPSTGTETSGEPVAPEP